MLSDDNMKIYINGELKNASENSYSGSFYLESGYDKYFAADKESNHSFIYLSSRFIFLLNSLYVQGPIL